MSGRKPRPGPIRNVRRPDRERSRRIREATAAALVRARSKMQTRGPLHLRALLEKRRRRRRHLAVFVLIVAALLLFLLTLCEDTRNEVAPEALPPSVPESSPAEPVPRVSGARRSSLQTSPPADPAWVQRFRQQVAATSLSLRRCVPLSRSPGFLRWTVLIDRQNAVLSDHRFEGLGETPDPVGEEVDCLRGVLDGIRFRDLETGGFTAEQRLQRVSLILEL